jgi:hypothetical protein
MKRYLADFLVARRVAGLWRFYPRRLKVWLFLNAELDGHNVTEG